ncbi:MAG TPA: PKD domain-containing protein [Gemmatimonadaceae bacterium]
MRRVLLMSLLVLAGAACGEANLEPLPLGLTITPNKSVAAPRDTISFRVTAQGGNLIGLQVDYADSTGDQFGTSGARTAEITFRHAYANSGTFQVTVTVTDGLAGQKTASTQIRVN